MLKIDRLFRLFLLMIVTFFGVVACGSDFSLVSPDFRSETEFPCRTVPHLMGETCVPENPQKVIVLGLDLLGDSFALDVEPIGTARFDTSSEFPNYLFENRGRAIAQEITNVGGHSNPNLETILRLQPDLIIGSSEHLPLYNKLTQIAPTVLSGSEAGEWKEKLMFLGITLNKREKAHELLDEWDRRVAEFQTVMGDRLTNTEVSVVNIRKDHVRLYLKCIFSGKILQDVGLPRPAAQDKNDFHSIISLEAVSDMDGDVVFILDMGGGEFKQQLQRHPLWFQLEAVQKGKVYEVNSNHWTGGNIIAANLVLDDLFRYLPPEENKL